MNYDQPGDPECPHCHGDGIIPVPVVEELGAQKIHHPPSFRRCRCVLFMDILSNVERGMPGLSKAPRVKQSKFDAYREEDLWVTAPKVWFMAHLRHVATRQPPQWYFKVVSDADLVTAWLASAALKGQGIMDPDAATVSMMHLTLVDLVAPPTLLIIRMGIKAARNVAAPEVLLEALNTRNHLNLPTWVWDQPTYPLAEGHICYAPQVGEYMSDWPHLTAKGDAPEAAAHEAREPSSGFSDMSLPAARPTLSTMTGSPAQPAKRRGKK